MNDKKRILLITTGGTIMSVPSEHGLHPGEDEARLLRFPGSENYDITVHSLLTLDSSNIQPEEWALIAGCIYDMRTPFDGIVITHGTDTMAYTASALTFMLPGIDRPVVLTGSQMPIANILSDGYANLQCAFAMAASGVNGVFIAFDRKVFLGCRAGKVRTTAFNAFESVNLPPVAEINAHGLTVRRELLPARGGEKCRLETRISSRVALMKLIPGVDPRLFSAFAGAGCRGLVIEAFGSGGINFLRRDVVAEISALVARGVAVVICSQCLYEATDMTAYEVGQRALDCGAIPAGDMTSEAAVTKLMWLLERGLEPTALAQEFKRNLHGEISE